MIEAGAFRFTGWRRKELIALLEEQFSLIVKEKQERAKGFLDLFGDEVIEIKKPVIAEEETFLDILRKEKELLGFYVTGHPLDMYKEQRSGCTMIAELHQCQDREVVKIACVLEEVQVRISNKHQKKFAIVKISDGIDTIELPVWSDLFESKGSLLVENALVMVIAQVDKKEDPLKLSCKWIGDLVTLNAQECDEILKRSTVLREGKKVDIEVKQEVKLTIDIDQITMKGVLGLKRLLGTYPGGQAVQITFLSGEREVAVLGIDAGRGIHLTPELETILKERNYIQ